jgi:FKBP-type peptidyl-prolyl cis-trans isomerase SlyD
LQARTVRGPVEAVVTAVDDDSIGVDANHPLAGQTFKLDVEVLDVRLATPEEVQFGVQQPT